jgi:hypothetical protein
LKELFKFSWFLKIMPGGVGRSYLFCHFKQLEGWRYAEGALNKRKNSTCL